MTKRNQFACGLALVSLAVVVQVLVESNVTSANVRLNMFVLHAMAFVWSSFAAMVVGSIFLVAALTYSWRKINSKAFGNGVVLVGAAILAALLLVMSIAFNLSGVNITF